MWLASKMNYLYNQHHSVHCPNFLYNQMFWSSHQPGSDWLAIFFFSYKYSTPDIVSSTIVSSGRQFTLYFTFTTVW